MLNLAVPTFGARPKTEHPSPETRALSRFLALLLPKLPLQPLPHTAQCRSRIPPPPTAGPPPPPSVNRMRQPRTAPAPDCASPGPQAYANGTRLQQVCIMRFCETKRRPTAFELPSAACGRNQLEGSCWPRAISRQLSIFIFVISPRNAEKLRRKDLGFFADCAAKKWPFGQPVPPAVCEKAAVSVQPSAISLRSAISFENLSARYDLQVHGSSLKPTMSDCSVAS